MDAPAPTSQWIKLEEDYCYDADYAVWWADQQQEPALVMQQQLTADDLPDLQATSYDTGSPQKFAGSVAAGHRRGVSSSGTSKVARGHGSSAGAAGGSKSKNGRKFTTAAQREAHKRYRERRKMNVSIVLLLLGFACMCLALLGLAGGASVHCPYARGSWGSGVGCTTMGGVQTLSEVGEAD